MSQEADLLKVLVTIRDAYVDVVEAINEYLVAKGPKDVSSTSQPVAPPATAPASTATTTATGERWSHQRDGGECIPLQRIQSPDLRGRLTEPGSRVDMGPYHYRSWRSMRNGTIMVSRYLKGGMEGGSAATGKGP
jgi:hypothetical protein